MNGSCSSSGAAQNRSHTLLNWRNDHTFGFGMIKTADISHLLFRNVVEVQPGRPVDRPRNRVSCSTDRWEKAAAPVIPGPPVGRLPGETAGRTCPLGVAVCQRLY